MLNLLAGLFGLVIASSVIFGVFLIVFWELSLFPCKYKLSSDRKIIKVKWWFLSHKLGKVETFYCPMHDHWFDKNGISATYFVHKLLERQNKSMDKKQEIKHAKQLVKEFIKNRKTQ